MKGSTVAGWDHEFARDVELLRACEMLRLGADPRVHRFDRVAGVLDGVVDVVEAYEPAPVGRGLAPPQARSPRLPDLDPGVGVAVPDNEPSDELELGPI